MNWQNEPHWRGIVSSDDNSVHRVYLAATAAVGTGSASRWVAFFKHLFARFFISLFHIVRFWCARQIGRKVGHRIHWDPTLFPLAALQIQKQAQRQQKKKKKHGKKCRSHTIVEWRPESDHLTASGFWPFARILSARESRGVCANETHC